MKKEIEIQTEEHKDEGVIPEDAAGQDRESEPAESDNIQSAPAPKPVDPVVELTDRLQRLAAEFENYKKRNAREFDRGRESGMVSMIERLLPALDSFDSALESFKGKDETGIYEGLGKIRELMVDSLKAAGLEVLTPEPGTPFDPHFHEVMLTLETGDFNDQDIVVTLQKGYRFKSMLIRAAKVQIAVEPSKTDA